MESPPPVALGPALALLCEDALFGVTAVARLDLEVLGALAKRRAGALGAAASGGGDQGLRGWDPWLLAMCAAIAPVAPPRWLPMADAVENLSLERGARGVRALFTTKPSEREIARVRSLGALCVRTLGSVLAASGTFPAEAKLLRATVIASLGLPEEDRERLGGEAPLDAEMLPITGDLDGAIARSLVMGGFLAAMSDGLDPREEQAVVAIARKAGLTTEAVNEARAEARKSLDATKGLGEAAVEAIRYVLADAPAEAEIFSVATARLALPAVHRRDVLTAINLGAPVILGRKHRIDRRQREAALALAWLAALHADPTVTRRAVLARRHDLVAADLADAAAGAEVRAEVDRFLDAHLGALLEPPSAP
jgi:hypothetical protein